MEINQVQSRKVQNGYREAFNKLCDVLGAGGIILPDEMVDGLWRELPRSPARDGEFPLCVLVPAPDDETDLNDTLVALVAGVARAFPVLALACRTLILRNWRLLAGGGSCRVKEMLDWVTRSTGPRFRCPTGAIRPWVGAMPQPRASRS